MRRLGTGDDLALDAYDDLAVAYEHLGRRDEAVATMVQKAQALRVHPDAEHQYRYHANLGTFLALRGDYAAALVELERAVTLEPNAHFGRERFQIDAVRYVAAAKADPGLWERENFLTHAGYEMFVSPARSFTVGHVRGEAPGEAMRDAELVQHALGGRQRHSARRIVGNPPAPADGDRELERRPDSKSRKIRTRATLRTVAAASATPAEQHPTHSREEGAESHEDGAERAIADGFSTGPNLARLPDELGLRRPEHDEQQPHDDHHQRNDDRNHRTCGHRGSIVAAIGSSSPRVEDGPRLGDRRRLAYDGRRRVVAGGGRLPALPRRVRDRRAPEQSRPPAPAPASTPALDSRSCSTSDLAASAGRKPKLKSA